MRSRYDLAQDSVTNGDDGTPYKDIFTIPTLKFQYTEPTVKLNLSIKDIQRPDIFVSRNYGMSEFDDIVWWLNIIGLIYDEEVGTEIELPSLSDMENFYYKYRL